MKQTVTTVGLLIAAGILLRLFPLFHVVPLKQLETQKQQAAFDAAKFAASFWDEKLTPAFAHAADSSAVLAAIRANPEQARRQFGRSVGLSRSYFYFLRGAGTVVSVDKNAVGIAIGDGRGPDLVLRTGLVFGNAVRDATGLTSAGDFANSQHFNGISRELNHLVETRVLPELNKNAAVGRKLHFVGCAEVRNEPTELRPLKVVPLQVVFE